MASLKNAQSYEVATEPHILSPKNGKILYSTPHAETVFSWKASSNDLVFSVSTEPLFEKPLFIRAIPAGQTRVQLKLGIGPYFWRLTPRHLKNKTKQYTSRAFEVRNQRPPELVYPPHLSVFEVAETTDSEQKSYLHSTAFVIGEHYENNEIRIFFEQNSQQPVVHRGFSGSRLDTVKLPPGKYFWQARGRTERNENLPWSPLKKFRIQNYNEPLNPPRLLSQQLSEHNVHGRAAESKISVVFDKVFGAKFYQFEIRINQNQPLLQKTNTPTLILDNDHSGVHLVRARAVHSENNISAWSKTAVKILHGQPQIIGNDRE